MTAGRPRCRHPLITLGGLLAALGLCLGALGAANPEPYPAPSSKKGLQVQMVDDAIALGIRHAALNFNLAQLVDPRGDTNNPGLELGGRTHRFQRGYLEAIYMAIASMTNLPLLLERKNQLHKAKSEHVDH